MIQKNIYLQILQCNDNTRDKIIKNISKEVIIEK